MNLTAKNTCNDLAIEMMFGKALCAYANWKNNQSCAAICTDESLAKFHADAAIASQSEYEATVRCLAMLTVEHLPEVCMAVINQAKEEFGI